MGLAAPKNRSKISNDPQNTTWSTNTSRFGHKLLTSQGWQPGTSLGAKNAAHAAHYTAASTSHVRVFLKEDNLGLGAKLGSEKAENFGLAGLESVLGRLNGRAEEVKKEEEERAAVGRRIWVSQRYGMSFVSGGFLVGGDIVSKKEMKEEEKKEAAIKVEVKKEEGSDGERNVLEISEQKVKKRKRVKLQDTDVKAEDEEPALKRKKKSMDLRAEAGLQDASQSPADPPPHTSRKIKKSKTSTSSDNASVETPLSEKALRKAEKRARKEEKKLKKALKKAAKSRSKSAQDTPADSSDEDEDEDADSPASASLPTTGTSTPITAAGLTFGAGGRHAVRQRYIRQKKMASMDPQALKEIFMIKT